MNSGARLTLYSVLGPSKTKRFDGTTFHGGWTFLRTNLKILKRVCEAHNLSILVIVGNHETFGFDSQDEFPDCDSKFECRVINVNPNDDANFIGNSGLQHGMILNHLLMECPPHTEFFGIIDPDCFIIDGQALEEIMRRMSIEGLGSVGVTYPNTFPPNYYWDFPVAYFQIFNNRIVDASKLNFMPAISMKPKSGLRRLFLENSLVGLLLRKRIMKIVKVVRNRNGLLELFIFLLLQRYLENSASTCKDTGWQNREYFTNNHINTEIIPVLFQSPKPTLPFFDSKTYIEANLDLGSNIDPTVHFLLHGIFENRDIGHQSLLVRVLVGFVRRKGTILKEIHPISSLDVVSNEIGEVSGKNFPRMGFTYTYKGLPFCIHLGHSAKDNLKASLKFLTSLENAIETKRAERGSAL